MHPSIKQLKFEGNAWKYAKEEGMDATRIMTGKLITWNLMETEKAFTILVVSDQDKR